MSLWDSDYYNTVKELAATQDKLRKADHDRKRYAKRIRLIQAQREILSCEYHALLKENEILERTVSTLERRLIDYERQDGRR